MTMVSPESLAHCAGSLRCLPEETVTSRLLTYVPLDCGEPQTMPHIVDSCLLTKLAGGLSKLHSADDDAVAWLTNYGGPQKMHTTTSTIARHSGITEMTRRKFPHKSVSGHRKDKVRRASPRLVNEGHPATQTFLHQSPTGSMRQPAHPGSPSK